MATTEGPIEDRSLDTDEEQEAWTPSEIEDRLLLGSIADATNGNALAEHGVTVVISILDDAQDHERLVLPNQTVKHVRFKCADRSDANLLQHLGCAASAVSAGLQNGGKVLVHCLEGRSRSSAVVCAYLIRHQRKSLRQAFALVKQRRELVRPNRGFWRQLVAFERGVLGSVSFLEEELPGSVMFEQDALDLMIVAHVASLAISPLKHPPRVQDDDQPPQAPTTTPECTPLPRKRKVPDSQVLDQHAGSPSRNREQPPSSVVEPENTTEEEELFIQ